MWERAGPVLRAPATLVALVTAWAIAAHGLPRGMPPGIVLFGAVFGSLYALVAIGLVLIWRASRVVNFAQAEFGSLGAVLAMALAHDLRIPYVIAAVVGLGTALGVGALTNVVVVRRLRKSPRFLVSVATIGVSQVLAGAAVIAAVIFEGVRARRVNTPFGGEAFNLGPVLYRWDHVVAMVAVPVVMLWLTWFLGRTHYGTAIRAAAENGQRASLLGVPVPRLATTTWALAAALSFVAVMLRLPLVGFLTIRSPSGSGDALLLRALAAAMFGRMQSLPRTVAAAIFLGIVEEAASWSLSNTDPVDAILVLVILVMVLLQRPHFRRTKDMGASTWTNVRPIHLIPTELRRLPEIVFGSTAFKLISLAVGVSLPLWAKPGMQEGAGLVAIYAIATLSLLVLTGWGGHIGLGQWAVAGFGGAATATVYGQLGIDALIAILAGIAMGALIATIVGLPVVGTRGPFMAVTTLTFAVASSYFFLEDRYIPWYSGRLRRPELLGLVPLEAEWQMYEFALAALLLTMFVLRNLRRTRTGRAIIAMRDNEQAAEAVSLHPSRIKLITFAISGAVAGLAGSVYVLHQRALDIGSFASSKSIQVFSMGVIGGLGSLAGPIFGVLYVEGSQTFLPRGFALVATGGGILVLLLAVPEGIGHVAYGARDIVLRGVARRRRIAVPSLTGADRYALDAESVVEARSLLELRAGADEGLFPFAGQGAEDE